MHLWCVLLLLHVLVAGALSPNDGCGFNTTVVANITPAATNDVHFDYSTSIVNTGLSVRISL